jgi:hypothetical protein
MAIMDTSTAFIFLNTAFRKKDMFLWSDKKGEENKERLLLSWAP